MEHEKYLSNLVWSEFINQHWKEWKWHMNLGWLFKMINTPFRPFLIAQTWLNRNESKIKSQWALYKWIIQGRIWFLFAQYRIWGFFWPTKTKRCWMAALDIYQTVKRYIKHQTVREAYGLFNSHLLQKKSSNHLTFYTIFIKCAMIELLLRLFKSLRFLKWSFMCWRMSYNFFKKLKVLVNK